MLATLLLGAAIVGIVAAFWEDLMDFLNKGLKKVRKIVNGTVEGLKVFVQKLRDGVKEIAKYYSRVGQKWEETTVTRTVSENDVPEEIRNKKSYKKNKETEVTKELEMMLAN